MDMTAYLDMSYQNMPFLFNIGNKSITKYQHHIDALYNHFVDLQIISRARSQNIGNMVKIP